MSESGDQTLRLLVQLGVIGEKDVRAAKDLIEETGNAAGKDLSTSLPEGAAAWEKYKDVLKDTGKEAGESHSHIRLITHTLREMGVEIPGIHLLLHTKCCSPLYTQVYLPNPEFYEEKFFLGFLLLHFRHYITQHILHIYPHNHQF